MVNSNTLFRRIHNPVFADTRLRINAVFYPVVHFATGRRYNFYNQVRSSGASPISKLIRVADNRNIWLYPVFIIGVKVDSEWGRIYLAVAMVLLYIFTDSSGQFHNKLLVDPAGWCHVIQFSVNEFGSCTFWQVPVVFRCILIVF